MSPLACLCGAQGEGGRGSAADESWLLRLPQLLLALCAQRRAARYACSVASPCLWRLVVRVRQCCTLRA